MGQFMCVGVCRKITIYKEDLKHGASLDRADEALKKEVNLSLYDKIEDDESVSWIIKKELIEDGLVDFIKAQLEIFEPEEDFSYLYDAIRKAKTYDKIVEMVESKYDEHLQKSNYTDKWIDLGGFDSTKVCFDLIVFLVAGKIFMECYSRIFNYFEKMIGLQKDKFPLAETVKVMIEG
ncbi:MAG: hypothetical protein GTO45_23360 [Candidatus Aminicenantes bacterium]|nr:hypothetical protein [Candidatus Aminicenantes bacterium]NIM81696.1 hypothetical protein [Candidatus Aminicenantes bacterium]NIN21067.1 hypothetical protein [Candidatus Aminicenantes bacterium]NIN44889.1 hypothetical protein [Candidatus Aminicenantes bacterium]NIN87703.1 hypothetical protein [Candidatus Aminicenantes bacterium]